MCYVIDAEWGANVAWSNVGGIGHRMNPHRLISILWPEIRPFLPFSGHRMNQTEQPFILWPAPYIISAQLFCKLHHYSGHFDLLGPEVPCCTGVCQSCIIVPYHQKISILAECATIVWTINIPNNKS